MTWRIFFSLLFCLLLQSETKAQTPFGFRTFIYTTENGLPSNGLKGMQWDESSGFLWIATEAGLSRFNGMDFVNFTRATTTFIASERIRFMVRNSDQQIRAADMNGNVLAINKNQPVPLYKREELTASQVDGWENRLIGAGISDSFFKVGPIPNPSRIAFPFAQLVPLSAYSALLFNPQGTVVLVDMKNKVVEPQAKWGNDNVIAFFVNKELYAQKRGQPFLYRWDNQKNSIEKTTIKLPTSTVKLFWETGMSYPIAIDGKLAWTIKQKNKTLSFELICNEVPNTGMIKYIQYSEKKGLLFLGSASRGFAVVRTNRVSQLKKEQADPIDATAYYSQWEVEKGSVLTNEGHMVGKTIPTPKHIPAKFGYSVYKDGDSLFWFSSGQRKKFGSVIHVLNLKNGTKKIYSDIEIFNVFAFAKWNNQTLIGNHRGLGVIQQDSLRPLFKASSEKLEDPTAFNLLALKPGVFSMTTCAGWIVFDLQKNKADTLLKLPGYCIRSQTKIGDYVFIGTYGKGIYIYHDGKLKSIPLDKNLFLLYAHCFVADKNGYVWISTNRGLFKAQAADMIRAFETDTATLYYHYFGKNDGMNMTELNGGCSPCALTLQDGTLSFPSMDGLLWVRPQGIQPLMPEGPLYIDKIEADNVLYSETAFTRQLLPHNYKSILINLAFSAWANNENIYIEYRVNDTARWMPLQASDGALIRLPNLPAGAYQLQIRKRNGFGENNYYFLTLPFTVGRAWYDNSVFYFGLLLLTVLLIYIFSSYQNRRLIKRQRELEQVVQEKTKDLQTQNDVLEKSNRINNRLISIISHDIVTPLKFLTATGRGLSQKKESLPEETQQELLGEIINTSQELHLLSTNILNWIKYQSGNKRLLTEKINGQELTQQVLSILSPLAREKNLVLHNEVDPTLSFKQFVEPLKILIYNLVLNAIRYSDSGNIKVTIQKAADEFKLIVSDQGVGMTTEKIESILNDAPLVYEKSTQHHGGHGLGYLIIRDIINWMQARIQIQSVVQKGTEVRVIFRSLNNQSVNNR